MCDAPEDEIGVDTQRTQMQEETAGVWCKG